MWAQLNSTQLNFAVLSITIPITNLVWKEMQNISNLAMNSSYLCLSGFVALDGAWKIMKGSTLHCIMHHKSQPFRLTLGSISSLNSALKHWNDFLFLGWKHVKVEVLKSFILFTGCVIWIIISLLIWGLCKAWVDQKVRKEKVSQVHFECISSSSFFEALRWQDK